LRGGLRDELELRNLIPCRTQFNSPPQRLLAGWKVGGHQKIYCWGSVASCYTTTFQAVAAYSQFDYNGLGVEVERTVKKINSGYAFQKILIRPTLTIADEEAQL
jgi:uncharacterized OsmC-like protein